MEVKALGSPETKRSRWFTRSIGPPFAVPSVHASWPTILVKSKKVGGIGLHFKTLILIAVSSSLVPCLSSTGHTLERPIQALGDSDVASLLTLYEYLDPEAPVTVADVDSIARYLESDCLPVKAAAATVLFAVDSIKYREVFNDVYAVHDYAERSDSIYHFVSGESVLEASASMHAVHREFEGTMIPFLLLYFYYGNHNEWFMAKEQRISPARFFRSAFVAYVYKGKDIDAIALVNRIDQLTSVEDLRNKPHKPR